MFTVALSLAAISMILVVSEALWRAKVLRGEAGRKGVHMLIGSFVAFWPYIMSFEWILAVSGAFLTVVILSHHFKIFHAIHDVRRRTWGEYLFAVGIGLAALMCLQFDLPRWFFATAVLHLSIADASAALAGKRYGHTNGYKVFGQQKSIIGSLAFWTLSTAMIVTLVQLPEINYGTNALTLILVLPIIATVVENITVFGVDNVAVPMTVLVMLSWLQVV